MESKIQNSERLVKELIANSENARNVAIAESKDDKRKKQGVFQKYKIKDIVFLAIITACTLIGGVVMPLLVNVPLFGIIQLGLGLQFSIFPVIGMMKVRKPGALIFISVFLSAFLIFMFPPMVMIIACAVVAEGVVLLLFRGYKNDWACVTAGTLYMPLTIPLLYLYYNAFYTVNGSEKQAVSMFIGASNVGAIIGISVAVVALCFAGSVIGMLISRELGKAGVLKK
ncbi:MAG: MptD family putative ECF transporter S component [Clostridia bacterium]|nr:MptD family putative ECF transporter S component [Clostridia bacterium]